MKKLFAILLAVMLLLSFAACGTQEAAPAQAGQSAASDSSSSGTAQSAGDQLTVGFALNDLDEAQSVVWQSFEDACSKKGIKGILANAAGSIDQQLTDIENFTTQDVDILIVSALDSNAVVDVCDAAKDAGILLIDYIMGINTEKDVYFGYSFYDMAAQQAQYLIDYLEANPDKTLTIGYMWGTKSMELCHTLYAGFTETMAASSVADRYTIVVEGVTEWSADNAITLTEDWLQAYPEIDTIVTMSDTLTCGVVEALRAAGEDPADYITIGKDGSADALKSIAEGGMTCTIYCAPTELGYYLADVCQDLYDGKLDTPNYQATIKEFITVTAENVADIS